MNAQVDHGAGEHDTGRSPRRPAPATTTARPGRWTPRIEVLTDLHELEALQDRWDDLVRVSPGATAYAAPAFVLAWYRHFERPGGIYAITVWRGDELVGLAPFARSRLGRGHSAVALLVSAGTEHGDYGDPLLDPDPDPEPVTSAIADHLAALVRRRTVVNLRRLRDDLPTLAALAGRDDLAAAPMGQVADAAVLRLDEIEDPAAHLRRLARRHGVPRRLRRLAEAHGEVEYHPATTDVTEALDTMRTMLARRWGPAGGPDLFRGARREAFTRDSMQALVDAGHGRIATVTAGGRPVALSTVLAVGDRYVSDNAAFDSDLAAFGPGQAEMHMLLDHAHRAGAREVDLRAGDFPYKYRWTNATRRTRSVALTCPGRQGDAMMAARRVLMSRRARRLARLQDG